VVVLHVELVAGLDDPEPGAHLLGVFHPSPCANAKRLRFIAGGNAAGRVGDHGYNRDGFLAQLRPRFLLNGSEVRVQIEEEPLHPFVFDHCHLQGGEAFYHGEQKANIIG
jgi:hypothetical protein